MARVLVVNDDGINSIGLGSLVEELYNHGFKVYVVAPMDQMSGVSKTVSFNRFGRNGRISYERIEMRGAIECWALNATPAESVLIALRLLLRETPDLVISGINSGPNMGLEDILTSGTVGAAVEAVLHGIPAMAVSLAHSGSASYEDYRVAAKITSRIASILLDHGLDEVILLNINIPLRPRGVAITKPSLNNYRTRFVVKNGFIEVVSERMEDRYWDRRPGSDVLAVLEGYISISFIDVFRILEVNERFKFKLGELSKRLLEELRVEV